MIRCNHQDIIRTKLCQNLRETTVKVRECRCITVHIVAVSVKHIEVYQVGKADSIEIAIHIFQRAVNAFCVA